MKGSDPTQEDEVLESDSFLMATPFRRILIMLGGVVANFVGAIYILAVILLIGIHYDFFSSHEEVDRLAWAINVSDEQIIVQTIIADSPAQNAGIRAGDLVRSINGEPMFFTRDVSRLLKKNSDSSQIVMELSSPEREYSVTLPNNISLGMDLSEKQFIQADPLMALPIALVATTGVSGLVAYKLPTIFASIVEKPSESLGGPVAIVSESAKASEKGFTDLLFMSWSLSLSLVFFNLLPIPGLDGGRIVFLLPELILKRKMNETLELVSTVICMLALFTFFILITIKDIWVIIS